MLKRIWTLLLVTCIISPAHSQIDTDNISAILADGYTTNEMEDIFTHVTWSNHKKWLKDKGFAFKKENKEYQYFLYDKNSVVSLFLYYTNDKEINELAFVSSPQKFYSALSDIEENGSFKKFFEEKQTGEQEGTFSKWSKGQYVYHAHDGLYRMGMYKNIYKEKANVISPAVETPVLEVKIGEQVWMKTNLNTVRFRNGDLIAEAKSDEDWKKARDDQKPAWCWPGYDQKTGEKYGRLYNWFAVSDPRELAPRGWHIPSREEVNQTINFLGGPKDASYRMKIGDLWTRNGGGMGGGSNSSGFSAIPAGQRGSLGDFRDFNFGAYFWTSESFADKKNAYYFLMQGGDGSVMNSHGAPKGFGASIRCIKD